MKSVLITDCRGSSPTSQDLITELIAPYVEVERWSFGAPSPPLKVEEVLDGSPEVIVLWRAEKYVDAFASAGHPNVVFVPTWDFGSSAEWADWPAWKNVRALSFCYAFERKLQKLGLQTKTFQYYPNPAKLPHVTDYSALRGFFCQQNKRLHWGHVRTLINGIHFERFCVNFPSDTRGTGVTPTLRERLFRKVAVTNCAAAQIDGETLSRSANFFVAPQCEEGPGLRFLEAMGMGMAVAALDAPVMNDYITDQVNGYLFDYKSLNSLNLTRFGDAGKRARETVELGRIAWEKSAPDVIDFLFEPTRKRRKLVRNAAVNVEPDAAPVRRTGGKSDDVEAPSHQMTGGLRVCGKGKAGAAGNPLVSVAIVVLNGRDAFQKTISSILTQSYEPVELLVIDGGSSDGTLDVIRKHGNEIDLWISEKDAGPYFAMNKAAQLALGQWIIFMNAGDWFLNEESVANAIRRAPDDADFIIGHHVYQTNDTGNELHKANDFESSWRILREGKLDGLWLQGIPAHQATFTRTALLQEHGYDTTFRIAADHDFIYRMRKMGRSVYHCCIPLSVYTAGGLSARNFLACINEWERTCTAHSEKPERVRAFFSQMRSDQQGISSELNVHGA